MNSWVTKVEQVRTVATKVKQAKKVGNQDRDHVRTVCNQGGRVKESWQPRWIRQGQLATKVNQVRRIGSQGVPVLGKDSWKLR
jgi:hypothetical protein